MPAKCATSEPACTTVSPVYGYLQRCSMVDFPGRLAAVLFTTGCNFRCGFCHNAALLRKRQDGLSWQRLEEALDHFRGQWADGVVITGGEPTIWEQQLEDLIDFFKRAGMAVKLDTNGSRPDVLERVLHKVDYVAMDVKCATPGYARLVGYEDIHNVHRSVDLIKSSALDYEFRSTIIEGVHSDDEMMAIADLIRGARRYVLQPFVPRENLPDPALRKARRTSPDRLQELRRLMGNAAREVVVRGQ